MSFGVAEEESFACQETDLFQLVTGRGGQSKILEVNHKQIVGQRRNDFHDKGFLEDTNIRNLVPRRRIESMREPKLKSKPVDQDGDSHLSTQNLSSDDIQKLEEIGPISDLEISRRAGIARGKKPLSSANLLSGYTQVSDLITDSQI